MGLTNRIKIKLGSSAKIDLDALGMLISCPEFSYDNSLSSAKLSHLLKEVLFTGNRHNELSLEQIEIINNCKTLTQHLINSCFDKFKDGLDELQHDIFDIGVESLWGTLDRAFIHAKRGHILAIQYRFGSKCVEPARSNLQAICYVLGIFQKYTKVSIIDFAFIHPRLKEPANINMARFIREEMGRMDRIIKNIIVNIDKNNHLKTHPKICAYCKKLITCPAIKEKIRILEGVDIENCEIDDELIESAKLSEHRARRILDRAKSKMLQGREYSGYHIMNISRNASKMTLQDLEDSPFNLDPEMKGKIPITMKSLEMLTSKSRQKEAINYFKEEGLIKTTEISQMRSKTRLHGNLKNE